MQIMYNYTIRLLPVCTHMTAPTLPYTLIKDNRCIKVRIRLIFTTIGHWNNQITLTKLGQVMNLYIVHVHLHVHVHVTISMIIHVHVP